MNFVRWSGRCRATWETTHLPACGSPTSVSLMNFLAGKMNFLLVLLKNGVDSAIKTDLGFAFQHNTSLYYIRAYRNSVSTAYIITNRGAS